MKYTYMIQKSGKKGKEWTNAQKGKTRTGNLDPLWVPTQGVYVQWTGAGRGAGKKGLKKREHFDLNWVLAITILFLKSEQT